MNLGFIGTGKIAASVITGICKSKISFKKIIISPRNKKIAHGLKRKYKKIANRRYSVAARRLIMPRGSNTSRVSL